MYITQIDDFINDILNKFNKYLLDENFFNKINSDGNFVKFQNIILTTIKKFIDNIDTNEILNIIKKESLLYYIINIIKRYCAFYIYLCIAYYYKDGRDLYIINLIECSKYQKDSIIQINDFFNSINNSKIIKSYIDIKNLITLFEFKTMDKIKIILFNNPIKYDTTIKLFYDLGEDYIIDYFLIPDNFHNIIKTLIFQQIYLKEEKNELFNILNDIEEEKAEYKYINIIVSNSNKIVDFNVIQKFLNVNQLKSGLAEEIYEYLVDFKQEDDFYLKNNKEYIDFLFSNKIIIPITEDFLRYHKDTEKYEEKLVDFKERETTKIKVIINQINNVRNYYSEVIKKNNKLKLEVDNYFYKQLDPKMAIKYNNEEEVKIINKLQNTIQTLDNDLVIDLEMFRKYAYINFRNFKNDGIKIRPTQIIEAIRITNLNDKNKNNNIEKRIGNNNMDLNVVGIILNPSNKLLLNFTINDLVNVRKLFNIDNGFIAFNKILEKIINRKSNKLYYWIFDNKIDKPILDKYEDDNIDNNITLMLVGIYNNYIKLINEKIDYDINNIKEINIFEYNNLLKSYKNKYNIDIKKYNKLFNKIVEESESELENIEVINKNIYKLPILKNNKELKNIIEIRKTKIEISIDVLNQNLPICNHYIKWWNILKLSKKTDIYNQAIFEYVKQYVKENDKGLYICKSCNEELYLQKYFIEGTYVEELDTFLTTNIIVNQKLEDMEKYNNFTRIIRNIEKNIERIAFILDINTLVGNNIIIKLKRRTIIKDIIDLILLHTEWLKKQPNNRIETFSTRFGIDKNLTTLFFFELKDDIFLTSSTDTDKYKIIKYNNIIAYMILVIILELNAGQIINLKFDKRFNFHNYLKINDILFENLFIRLNQKGKYSISKIPIFGFILYYFTGLALVNKLWLWNDIDNSDVKQKQIYFTQMHKVIIHTIVDLINTISDANFEEKKNYLYEIIFSRFNVKITKIFNDNNIYNQIQNISNQNISIDVNNNIVIKKQNKYYINLDIEYNELTINKTHCNGSIMIINKNKYSKDTNDINILTNCDDGKFHNWIIKDNNLVCSLCKNNYNDLVKNMTETSEENYNNKFKFIQLNKLSNKYCISGELHVFNNDICEKCKINITTFKPTEKELLLLEKNLNKINDDNILNNINKIDKYYENIKSNETKEKKIMNKFKKKYIIDTDNNIENYIIDFVEKIIKITGNNIKTNKEIINIKDTYYLIDHDIYGFPIKIPFIILTSDNKIHEHDNKIIYYKDNSKNVYVFYDIINLQYMGYSDKLDIKLLKQTKYNASLKKHYSIKDILLLLGFSNEYYNINNQELNNDLITKILRERLNNLKDMTTKIQSLLYNIINKTQTTPSVIYNEQIKHKHFNSNMNVIEQKYEQIINEYKNKIKNINLYDNEKHNIVFKNYKIILNNINIKNNIPNIKIDLIKNNISVKQFKNLNNNDNKLLYYILYNFNKLIDYNDKNTMIELSNLIVIIIKYIFDTNYISYFDYNIKQFEILEYMESPDINDTLQIIGTYNELLNVQEINDPITIEDNYDEEEAITSLDIDDYEVNDDIDDRIEALDGYDNN